MFERAGRAVAVGQDGGLRRDALAAGRPGLRAVPERAGGASRLDLARIREFVATTAGIDHQLDDAARVDQIEALERLKAACAAAQARLTADLHTSQRDRDRARGIDAAATARSVGGQVALARRDSPHRGNRHLGLALALTREMPHTLAALSTGRVSEHQATLVARATACLSAQDRTTVDTRLAGRLGDLSDRRLDQAARAAAARVDPAAVTTARRHATSGRRVRVRPAPETMTYLTALLPVTDGVACQAALTTAADRIAATTPDPRTKSQIMADLLVERVTGRSVATGADVEVQVVLPVDTLLRPDSTSPGWIPDHGPIPADLAHTLARGQPAPTSEPDGATNYRTGPDVPEPAPARRFLRRLFATPDQSRLVGMESGRREYTGLLAHFITLRDQTCRMPSCDAPIRHLDHVTRHADGGPTTASNGQGLCASCNYLKEHPDWRVETDRAGPPGRRNRSPGFVVDHDPRRDTGAWHQTVWTTPTGHTYHSGPPPPGR